MGAPSAADLQNDRDFLAAPPEQKAAYLASVDPDFAKASAEDRKAYLDHVAPPPQPAKSISTRIGDFSRDVGSRLKSNLDLPAVIHGANQSIQQYQSNPDKIGAWKAAGRSILEQYKKPANIAGDLLAGWITGKALTVPEMPLPAIEETPSILRGKGTYGTPVSEWGKAIPDGPSPSQPINIRTPGQIAPEMIRPRAYYAGPPPQPIPIRSGLALPGEVAPPRPEILPPVNVRRPGEIPPTMVRPRAYYAGPAPEPIPTRQGLALPSGPAETLPVTGVRAPGASPIVIKGNPTFYEPPRLTRPQDLLEDKSILDALRSRQTADEANANLTIGREFARGSSADVPKSVQLGRVRSILNPWNATTADKAIPLPAKSASIPAITPDLAKTGTNRLKLAGRMELSEIGKARGIDLTNGRDRGASGVIAGTDTAAEQIMADLSPEEVEAMNNRAIKTKNLTPLLKRSLQAARQKRRLIGPD